MTLAAYTITPTAWGGLRIFRKGTADVISVTFDWSAMLESGETITGTPGWELDAGITKDSQSNTTTSASAVLSSGTTDTSYTVSCSVTTTGGAAARTYKRACTIQVRRPPV